MSHLAKWVAKVRNDGHDCNERRSSPALSNMLLPHSDGSDVGSGDGISATRTSDPTTGTVGASMRKTRHLATSTRERAATRVTATTPAVAISNHAWKT